MSTKLKLVVVSSALLIAAGAANAGCGKGAAAGAVIGHVAGKHGVAGAAVGCAMGHHSAKKKAAAVAASNGAAPAADATVKK